MITEVTIGPFVFEYDERNHEMYVSYPEEHIGTVHDVWAHNWTEFLQATEKLWQTQSST